MKKISRNDLKLPYDLYHKQALIAQAVAHPVRIAILNVLPGSALRSGYYPSRKQKTVEYLPPPGPDGRFGPFNL